MLVSGHHEIYRTVINAAYLMATSLLGRECTVAPKEKPCYRCSGVGHISRDCPQAPSGDGYSGATGGQECYKCGHVGHIARNCSQGGYSGDGYGGRQHTCYSCGGHGHMARDCTHGQKCYNCKLPPTICSTSHVRPSEDLYILAFVLDFLLSSPFFLSLLCECILTPLNLGGEVGHVSRDCPSEARGERVCYKCKQPGHVQAACPN